MSTVSEILAKATPKLKAATISSPKAKAEIKADLDKGKTKAKTAKTPTGKQKLAQKIKEAQKAKMTISSPGFNARCRAMMGGCELTGLLLAHIAHLWKVIDSKWKRNGLEYLALSRADWAFGAGLSDSEMNNYALPRLRAYGFGIVEARQMGNGKNKLIWVRLDVAGFREALDMEGYELKVAASAGAPLFPSKQKPYPNKLD